MKFIEGPDHFYFSFYGSFPIQLGEGFVVITGQLQAELEVLVCTGSCLVEYSRLKVDYKST
jgi:hypothetical protein